MMLVLLSSDASSLRSGCSRPGISLKTINGRRFSLFMNYRNPLDMDTVPVEVLGLLHDEYRSTTGLAALLPELLSACRTIGSALRDGVFTADKTGTENPFGDQQLDVDIRADKVGNSSQSVGR